MIFWKRKCVILHRNGPQQAQTSFEIKTFEDEGRCRIIPTPKYIQAVKLYFLTSIFAFLFSSLGKALKHVCNVLEK